MATFLRLTHLLFVGTIILIMLTFTQKSDPVLYQQIMDNLEKIDKLDCLKSPSNLSSEECAKQFQTLKEELDFSGILDAHMPDSSTQNLMTFVGVMASVVCLMLRK